MSKANLSFIILLIFIFSNSIIYPQSNTYYGGSGHFSVGTTFLDYSTVNTYLRNRQLPDFAFTSLNIGGGGYGIFNSFILGGEGGAITASSAANARGEASISAGFGMFNTSYILPLKEGIKKAAIAAFFLQCSLFNFFYNSRIKQG